MATKKRTKKAGEEQPASERLAAYEAKRDFQVTPEPAPHESPAGKSSQAEPAEEKKAATELVFAIQKHDARRLHYDVRLEINGAMVSWAVPKGPSYDPHVKRLAVQTEDHPMQYASFEGRIPAGQYGAGDMLLWDRGTYETVPPGQERAMLQKGHLHVRLFGDKLVGDWHFVKTKGPRLAGGLDDGAGGQGQAQWLFFKAQDRYASKTYDVLKEHPESVLSGRSATRGPDRVGASEKGKSARTLKETVGDPMLAEGGAELHDPDDWIYEVKYDGYRLLGCKAGPDVRLYTRKSNDWTDRFRPIADALAKVPARECVLDGEACAVDDEGKPSFHALQLWLGGETRHARIGYVVFDLLWLDGRDLRGERIEVRRELLEKLLDGCEAPLSFSRAAAGKLEDLVRAAKDAGLEGLMAKAKGSRYVAGRSGYWRKLRFDRRQDCAIIGWVPLTGTTTDVGALVLAVADEGKLVFAGKVGTGFDSLTRRQIADRLAAQPADKPQAEKVPRMKDARWVVPALCCEVAFQEWTDGTSEAPPRRGQHQDGTSEAPLRRGQHQDEGPGAPSVMRFPTFRGLREDKAPLECTREDDAGGATQASKPVEREEPDLPPPPSMSMASGASSVRESMSPTSVRLTNPDKVLFPADGYTKRDVWDYYTAIAPAMLPQISGRPLTMQRYPDGIRGEEWYQHRAPLKMPSFVRLVDTGPRHDNKGRIVCDDLVTLQYLANLAALTLHQWCVHVPRDATTREAIDEHLARPDYFVIDLDPGDGTWAQLIEVALALRTLFEALSLASFVKTSGKRGLHVMVPFAPGPTHAQATGFAEQVARAVAKVLPGIATVERMKEKRGGKLYVDYGQNGEGRTIVAPYTIRARDGAVVSTPVAWDEVTNELDPTRFTIRTVPERVAKRGDLLAGLYQGASSRQKLPG
jgi:bifunctional non-homologous end joining protein LigD